jgi:hypothetical protein
MSGCIPNRNPGFPGRAYNAPVEPRHGRIPSDTRFFDPLVTPSRDRYPEGPTSPPQGHRPIPTVARHVDDAPTSLQRFSEGSIVPFCRWAFAVENTIGNGVRSNYNYDPDIDNAIWWSETIVSHCLDSPSLCRLSLRQADTNSHQGCF